MPERKQSRSQSEISNKFLIQSLIFGPIRPADALLRQTTTAIKARTANQEFYTDITLLPNRSPMKGMLIEYSVSAKSPDNAIRVGAVYLSHLCDLISAVTQCPVKFLMPDEDSYDDRGRMNRRTTNIERELTEDEWIWITGNIAHLRQKHPRFLAAASWYRKGLIGRDTLDDFCCFWRVIERMALTYADKSTWSDEDRNSQNTKKCVGQLVTDLFVGDVPDILADVKTREKIYKMRCDIAHGNEPITPTLIESADNYLQPLADSAYSVLAKIREKRLPLTKLG